jgi:hypothetical protein
MVFTEQTSGTFQSSTKCRLVLKPVFRYDNTGGEGGEKNILKLVDSTMTLKAATGNTEHEKRYSRNI